MTTNGYFGHSGQSEESGIGTNGFPMSQNLGIDTKIKSLGLSKQKLRIWPFSGIFGFLYLNEIDVRGLKTLSYLDNFGCEHLSQ